MPERVERERLDIEAVIPGKSLACPDVLLLQARRLDMTAASRGLEYPFAVSLPAPGLYDRARACSERNSATRILGLAVIDLDSAFANVLPAEAKALFRSNPAVEQDRPDVRNKSGVRMWAH